MAEPAVDGAASTAVVDADEAALIDGRSRAQESWRTIRSPTGPGLVATSVYGFIQARNESIIDTFNDQAQQNLMALPPQDQTRRGTFRGPLTAGSILTATPVVIFFLVIQRTPSRPA
jgi:N,N'-diacetylchitobiose transport system permease protein